MGASNEKNRCGAEEVHDKQDQGVWSISRRWKGVPETDEDTARARTDNAEIGQDIKHQVERNQSASS